MKKVIDCVLVVFLCFPFITTAQETHHWVTISGKIIHPKTGTDISAMLEGQRFKIKVKEDGSFQQKMPAKPGKQGVIKGYLRYGRVFFRVYFTQKANQLHLTMDAEKPQSIYERMEFSGSAAKLNNFTLARKKKYKHGVRGNVDMSFVEYKDKVMQRIADEMALLNDYKKGVPAYIVQQHQNYIKYNPLANLYMQPDAYKYELPKTPLNPLPDIDIKQFLAQFYTAYLAQKTLKSNQREGAFYKEWYKQATSIAKENRDAILSNVLMQGLRAGFTKDLNATYQNFKSICKAPKAWRSVERVYQSALKLAKGQPAPDFTLEDVNGKSVKLSDYKGKAIYLDFWASWCKPCLAEMPHSKKVKEKFTGKDIVFVYISIDQNRESWKKMMKAKQMKGAHLLVKPQDQRKVMEAYNFMSIPTYVLIDAQGKIVNAKANRPSNPALVQDIEAMLAK